MTHRESFIVTLDRPDCVSPSKTCDHIRFMLAGPTFGKVTVRREFVNKKKCLKDGTVVFPDGNRYRKPSGK